MKSKFGKYKAFAKDFVVGVARSFKGLVFEAIAGYIVKAITEYFIKRPTRRVEEIKDTHNWDDDNWLFA